MAIETSLILLKPDAVEKNLTGQILARLQAAGLRIRGMKMMQLGEDVLLEHYAHITHLPVFPAIVEFMTKAPVIAIAMEGENAIATIREMQGPTDSKAAAPGTLRGDFGVDKMVNVCHASCSQATATVELKRFFKDEELFDL